MLKSVLIRAFPLAGTLASQALEKKNFKKIRITNKQEKRVSKVDEALTLTDRNRQRAERLGRAGQPSWRASQP